MNKNIFKATLLALCISIMLWACSKHNNDINSSTAPAKIAVVNFDVSGFSMRFEQMNAKANPVMSATRSGVSGTGTGLTSNLTDYAKQMYIWVYQVNGSGQQTYYHSRFFDSTALSQNNLADTLPYGIYYIYAFTKDGIITFQPYPATYGAPNVWGTQIPTLGLTGYYHFNTEYGDVFNDYFVAKFERLAIDGVSNKNIPLSFKRISSRLEIIIKDMHLYPNLNFTYTIGKDGVIPINYYLRNDSLSYGGYTSYTPYVNNKKIINGRDSIIQNLTNTPFTVQITANGSTKTIKNVICYPNRKTIVEGNFFDSSASNTGSSFNINLNGVWDSIPVKIGF